MDHVLDEEPLEAPGSDCINENLLSNATTGVEVLQFLKTLLPGRSSKNQGYTYNRVMKTLNVLKLLPANLSGVYGNLKVNEKNIVNEIIHNTSLEKNGRADFVKIVDAALNREAAVASIVNSDNEGGILVNRWALMVEFHIHSIPNHIKVLCTSQNT